jgi:Dolichyl-phosphate-mannose-protein mannosyltransferase
MRLSAICRWIIATDAGILVLSALSVVVLHTATNGQYGFHRDELATIDDARFLSWGYVVYPPITPFVARVSLTLFGASMIGLRLFAALAVGIAMVLTGLMAREIGGRRPAQMVAAWAAAVAAASRTAPSEIAQTSSCAGTHSSRGICYGSDFNHLGRAWRCSLAQICLRQKVARIPADRLAIQGAGSKRLSAR